MRKKDTIREVASLSGQPQVVCEPVIDAYLKVKITELIEESNAKLGNIGTLKRKVQAARSGIMATSGKEFNSPQTWKVTFKASKRLKTLVRENAPEA